MGRGTWGVFFPASLILQKSPEEECRVPWTTGILCFELNDHAVWTEGVRLFLKHFRIYKLALSCWPLCNCASGRFITSIKCTTVHDVKIEVAEESCAWCSLHLAWNAAQMCCFSICGVLVGFVPTLLFTEVTVQAWFKYSWSPLNPEHVVRCWLVSLTCANM